MWKGFPPWQQGWRIEVCFFPALWRIKTAACPLASEQGIPCCLHCRQWMCWNCWLQFMLEDVIQKSRPVCVLSPTPADSQAPSSFLATRGSLPFSPLSFLILISALECLLNGREEGICSILPEPCWSCCHLLQTYWARLSVLLLGKSAPPVAVTRTASVCRRAHGTGKEPLPGEQEDDGKRNVPVCLSQNESVPLLVPVLPGISIKDSWLFGSACQYISTTRKH